MYRSNAAVYYSYCHLIAPSCLEVVVIVPEATQTFVWNISNFNFVRRFCKNGAVHLIMVHTGGKSITRRRFKNNKTDVFNIYALIISHKRKGLQRCFLVCGYFIEMKIIFATVEISGK